MTDIQNLDAHLEEAEEAAVAELLACKIREYSFGYPLVALFGAELRVAWRRYGPGRHRQMVRTVIQRAVPETTHEDVTTLPEYALPAERSAWLKTTRQRKARRIQAKAAFLADPTAANLAELFYLVDLGECVPAEYEKTSAVEMGGADGKNDGSEWPPTRSA